MINKRFNNLITIFFLCHFINLFSGEDQISLVSTNLPLVVINTNGGIIVDEPKIMADMKIIYNGDSLLNKPSDAGNIYNGKIGIEIRGRYSARLPQQPYGIETRDTEGNNLNISLLGMPEENDWILLANYNDKTFIRNMLTFHLAQKMEHYAPRHHLCEVIINNEYLGIYILTEKIKQDKNRVDIADLNASENTGDDLTGGYIFKTDYYSGDDSWESGYNAIDRPESQVYFVYEYPKPDEITVLQKNYIEDFVNSFEKVLRSSKFADQVSGYPAFIDVKSFADYFIIGEFTRNVDAYKKSRYLYKDKDSKGGLIHSGPVWDYDWALKNISECIVNNTDGSGWAYEISSVCQSWPVPPGWMTRLLEDSQFANLVKTRYMNFRKTIFSEAYIENYCDSIYNLVKDAQVRHYEKWPILSVNVGAPEVDAQPSTYLGHLNKLKDWIAIRVSWLDDNMPGKYDPTDINVTEQESLSIRFFPNPVIDHAYIESEEGFVRLDIYSSTGEIVKKIYTNHTVSFLLDLSDLSPGLFVLKVCNQKDEYTTVKFIKRKY